MDQLGENAIRCGCLKCRNAVEPYFIDARQNGRLVSTGSILGLLLIHCIFHEIDLLDTAPVVRTLSVIVGFYY